MVSWICVALFGVSMISGLIVAFAYKPSLAYDSVQMLTYVIPYGDIFRKLHYFSSEAFLLFTLLHLLIELSKQKVVISAKSWNFSILAFGIILFLMFTGYVLKADLSGLSAGEVALSIVKQTPVLNSVVFLFEDLSLFVWKFYLWHILYLPLFLVLVLLLHVKSLKTKYFIIGLGISIGAMMLFSMPKDVNPQALDIHVHGPWFFRGAENLLMEGVPTLLVDLVMAIPFLLLVVYFYKEAWRRWLSFALFLWCGAYASLYFL